MPERDWRLRIQDISVAMEKIERYTDGMTPPELKAALHAIPPSSN